MSSDGWTDPMTSPAQVTLVLMYFDLRSFSLKGEEKREQQHHRRGLPSDPPHPSVEQSTVPSQAHSSLSLLTQNAGKWDTVNTKSIKDSPAQIMNSGASAKTPASRWSANNRRRWSTVIFDIYSSNCQKMLVIVHLLVHFSLKC